jgi:hypothetical protein
VPVEADSAGGENAVPSRTAMTTKQLSAGILGTVPPEYQLKYETVRASCGLFSIMRVLPTTG